MWYLWPLYGRISATTYFKFTQLKFLAAWKLRKQGNSSVLVVSTDLLLSKRTELLNGHRHLWARNELQKVVKVMAKYQ
jgi:hypothetical protein